MKYRILAVQAFITPSVIVSCFILLGNFIDTTTQNAIIQLSKSSVTKPITEAWYGNAGQSRS